MRDLLLLCLTCLSVGSTTRSHGHRGSVKPDGAFNYHERIGIPLAARIKAFEDRTSTGRKASISTIEEHPYMAGIIISIVDKTEQSTCGASLLSANRLVTAAHCWFDGVSQAYRFIVALGSNRLYYDGIHIITAVVIVHPQWDPSWLKNDIAMIYLPYSIDFSSTIQPIAIPSGADINNKFVTKWAVASGYGIPCDLHPHATKFDAVVRKMSLQVITEQECQLKYGEYVTPSTICTSGCGGVGLCLGFSGAPLVVERPHVKDNILIGVGSFSAKGVCQQGHPSVFSRVTSYINFISQHL